MIENTFGVDIVPSNDSERLSALHRYRIVGTPSEESFDSIAKIATQIFNVPIALLSLVDAESVFFKANIGMGKATQSNRGKSLCALSILDKNVTVFEDALKEPCLLTNPNVTSDFGLRFYAGAPLITHDGFQVGTLCIIDRQPRSFDQQDRSKLAGLAKIAMDQIELRRSALDTIDEVAQTNILLSDTQEQLEGKIRELATANQEMEATNHELFIANSNLNKSYDLTVLLNRNLTKSELRFKSFISKAPIAMGLLSGRELTIEVANNMILKVWNKDKSVIGKPLQLALPELEGQPYLGILDEVFTSGKTYTGKEAPVQLESDGIVKDYFLDFIYEPLKNDKGETNAIIVIANDITDRVTAREQQNALNKRLELALKAGKLGSFNLELASGIMICSEQCKGNYGLTIDDPFDFQILLNLIVPEYRETLLNIINEAVENQAEFHAEYLVKWPDDSLHWINASGMPVFDANGVATHLTGVSVDITKRKNYDRQKDDFLSIASHELKTPITSLKANLQLLSKLKTKPENPILPKLIDQASKSMDKLNSMVNELLNVNRISEGQLHLDKTTFVMADLLNTCCSHIRLEGKHKLIVKGNLSSKVYADEHRIDQVATNFINNAVKYASKSEEIHLIIEELEEDTKVIVQDFGEGIDAGSLPFLFDRYFRADHKSKTYSGLGLGLYISSEIIKRHGGTVGVESTLGKGSSFWFTLPRV